MLYIYIYIYICAYTLRLLLHAASDPSQLVCDGVGLQDEVRIP